MVRSLRLPSHSNRPLALEQLESRCLLSVDLALLKDINAIKTTEGSDPSGLVDVDGRVFFSADTPRFGRELWSTDGTEDGTTLVADLSPGSSSTSPGQFAVAGDKLFFAGVR